MNCKYKDQPIYSKEAFQLLEWTYEELLALQVIDDPIEKRKKRLKVIKLLRVAEKAEARWHKYNKVEYCDNGRWKRRSPLNEVSPFYKNKPMIY